MSNKRAFYIILAIFSVVLLFGVMFGCNQNPFFGVGPEVDTERPSVVITSHLNGQWEKPSFSLSGNANDNIDVSNVKIREIKKDSNGVEYVSREWNASLNGGEGNKSWARTFDLTNDFNNEDGFKTLDVYAFDARENFANTRILLGVTKDMSIANLTSPIEENLPANQKFVGSPKDISFFTKVDNTSDKFDNLKYYFNKKMEIAGYTKAVYPPDKSVTLNIYDSQRKNIIYTDIINGDLSTDKAKGNTSTWTFRIDTTSLKLNNNVLDNTACYVEIVTKDQAGQDWKQGKGYVYVLQSTDYPNGEVTSPESVTLTDTVASGKVWDDDGIDKIYWYLGKNDPTTDYTQWGVYGWERDPVTGLIVIKNPNYAAGVMDLTADPLLYPWSLKTSSGIGDYKLYINPVDKFGVSLLERPSTKTFSEKGYKFTQKTVEPPKVESIDSPDIQATHNNNVTIKVSLNAGQGKLMNSVLYRIQSDKIKDIPTNTKWDSGWIERTDVSNDTKVTHSYTFDVNNYVSATIHDVKITIKCKNSIDEESQESFINIKADHSNPTLSITYPNANAGLNGKMAITSLLNDDWAGVKSLYVGYFASAPDMAGTYTTETALDTNTATNPTLGKWIKIDNPKAAMDVTFDSTVITSTKVNPYSLYIATVDKVGNVGFTSKQYNIDQDLDIPSSIISVPATNGDITLPSTLISGDASDDDGLKALYWFVGKIDPALNFGGGVNTGDPTADYTTWNTYTGVNASAGIFTFTGSPKSSSWKIDSPSGSGYYKVHTKVIDIGNKVQKTSATRNYTQKLTDKPEIVINGPDTSITYNKDVTIDVSLTGGSIDKVTKISYRVWSTLKQDDTTHDIVSPSLTPAVVINNYKIALNLQNFVNVNVHDVKVFVSCSNEVNKISQIQTISLKSDIVSPTVKILSPSLGTGINGMWDIAGEVTDDWAGIKSIYVGYFTSMTDTIMNTTYTKESSLNNATSTVPTNGKWYKLSQVSAAWSHGFDTTLIYNDETSHSYNFYVATVDNTGNVGYGKLNYNINQALDRPTAAITSPAINGIISPNSNGSGDASDDDGIKIIYWFVGKTDVDFGNGVGIAPTDYTTWDTFSDANSKGGIIDLSASNPKITSLNFTTPSGDGDYKISVMVVDKNNKPSSSVITRNYQQYASTTPTATLTGIDQSTTYKGSVNVNIAAYGGGPYSINKIEYRVDNGSWTDITGFTVGKTVNYILPINTVTYTSSTDSDVKVEVRCTNDNSIVSNISSVSFKADNTSPTFSISAPATNAGLNGVEHITGGISDNFSGVKSMYIGYFNGAINTTDYDTETELNTASTAGLTLNKWFKITAINAAYDVTFDTTKIYSDESSHAYTLYVASIDNVGNVTHINKSVTINQALDRPSISVSTPTNNSTLLPYSVASGSATDDDGVQYIYYYIGLTDPTSDYKTWGGIDNDQSTDTEKSGRLSVSGKTVSWNFRTPKGVGSFRMRLVPEDINGKPATSTTSVNYAQQTSDSPTIQINAPNASITHTGTVTVDVDTSGGGTKTVSQIKYQIKSTKLDSGIVTLSAPADFTAGQGSINKTFTFNSASYTDSSVHSIDIEVWTINSNAETSLHMKTTINADNVKPTINITFPNALAGLNGITTLTRVVSDDWSGLKSAYIGYFAGMTNGTMDTSYTTEASVIANSSTSLTLGKWFKLASVSASADVTFDTTVITSTVANPHNLYLVLVDNVGNLSYTSRAFDINQNYDRPDASISTPSNAAIVFPSSVVSGSANDDDVSNLLGGKDNDGLQYVYWFVGKSDVDFGNGVGNAPSDQATWSTYNTANAKGGVIDLTSTKPKTYAFQPTDIITPTGSGNYRIHIKPMDMKNKVPVANITRDYVQKASDIPAIEFVSSFPDTTTNYNGTVTVKVNANGGSIDNVTKIFYKVESTVLADGSYTEKTDFTAANTVNAYTFTFNINSYVSSTVHDVTVSVYCENAVAKTSQVTSITIKGDNTKPTVAITSPAANAGLNGNWSIAGTVSDDWSGAKAIYVGYFANMTNGTMDGTYTTEASLNPSGTPTINRWYQLSSATAAWSHTFDTTVITNSTGNPKNPYNLYVVAVDNVGNRQYTSRAFDINQDYDKPHVRILSPATNSRVSPLSIVSGDATDDDGVQYVYYYVCNDASLPALYTDWSSTVETAAHKGGRIDAGNATSYSWQLTTPSGVGSYTVYTRVVDMYGKPNDVNVSLAFKQFSTDVPTVSITSITADRSSGTKYYGNVVINTNSIGGDIDKVTKVYYRINSGSWVEHDVVDASPRTDSYTFDINPLVDGTTHDVLVEVKCDNEALKTSTIVSTTIQGDDTVPTLAIDSPANNATDLNKWWTVRGTVSDDLAGVKTLYYGYFAADPTMTDYDTEAELEASASTDLTTDIMVTKSWHKVPFTNQYSWTYSYNTSKITATTKTNYKLYVVAVDNLGMVNSSIYKTVNINQDADKPTVTILSPASASRVSPSSIGAGSSTDDDGIKYIYYYVCNDGSVPALYTDWSSTVETSAHKGGLIDVYSLTSSYPTSYSWSISTPTGVGDYTLYTRIVDKYDTPNAANVTRTFKQFNTDVPTVSITSITADRSSGTKYYGNVVINTNSIGGDIDKVTKVYYRINSGSWVEHDVVDASPRTDSYTFDINPLVDGTTHDVLVEVKCDNEALKTSTIVSTTIQGDDTVPTLAIDSPTDGSTGLNKWWTVRGTVSDDLAGVKTLYYGYFAADPTMTDYDTEAELEASASTDLTTDIMVTKSWHKVPFTNQYSWTYSYNTSKITATTKTNYKLYVVAVDNLGMVNSSIYKTVNINQDADKPTVTILSPASASRVSPSSIASGSSIDDDGIKYIYWFVGKVDAGMNFGGGAGTGDPTADYNTWTTGTLYSLNATTGRIDLSGTNPASYSWQFTTPSGVGSYKISMWIVDKYDVASSLVTTVSYKQLTTDVPTVTVTSPTSLTSPSIIDTRTGNVTITVNASGGDIDKVKKISYKVGSDAWVDYAVDAQTVTGHTHTFNIDGYVDASNHDLLVQVRCENDAIPTAKTSTIVPINLKGDDTKPTVSISNPSWGASGLNGTWSILGSVSDDWAGVKTLYYGYFSSDPDMTNDFDTEAELLADSDTSLSNVSTTTKHWHKVTFSQPSWTYSFDTTKVADGTYKLYVAAVDNVGKVSWAYRPFGIDQNADKPTSIVNVPTNGQNTFPGSVASGSATDDDGLKYIYWYIGSDAAPALYTDWPSTVENSVHKGGLIDLSSSNPATYSWQLITPSGVGSYTVYIRTVDMNNVVQAANITRNYSQSTSTSPVSQITSPDPSVTQKGTMVVNVHSTGGGSYNVIKVHYRITSTKGAGQDSGWQFVTIGSPYSEGDTTFDVDTTTYVDATVHDVKVEVYSENDNSGYSQHVTTYFRGDNNPPSVTISSPTAPSTINGVQKFSGTDSDWSTVKALYISYYETTPTGSISTEADLETRTSATDNGGVITGTLIKDSFYKIVSPSTSWTHNFDTLIVKPTGSIASYNFYIYAVDNVGNIQSATNTYSLDQDLDKPQALITQPAYSGSQVTPWLDVASMNKYGQDFLLMGTGSDDDGVDRVRFTLQLMDYTGGGHSVNSTIDNLTTALGTANWSYTKSGLAICTASQYYKLTTEVRDINGRVESGATSYFIVSNEIPVIDIMWPSTLDPDNDQRYDESITQKQRANDSFGTVISNVRDDIYWDNDTTNNHMYLKYNGNYPSSDTTQSHYDLRYFYGWENQVANDDSNNDGIPETPAVTYADFNESTLSIFNTEASDSTRANYFRMIFKAKDPNSGGDIRKVEYSTNGGSTWTTAFNWNGTILANQDTSKYAKVDNQGGDGYTWFYIDLDTSILGTSQIVKVRITDNNLPTAYFSESSMQMTFDNTAPTGSFVAWGTADPSDHQNFSITNSYFGGNADDAASGVRYAKLYIWDNQGTADSPTYGDGSGTITVNLNNPTRTVKVSIPNDISTILPTGGTDIQPDYLLKANMYTPQNWRVTDMYGDINTKYAQYPSDGRKLICLEVTDNAGNTYKTFTELEFSEFPAVVGTSNIYYGPMTSGEKFALSDQTTSGRIWVSGNLNLDGVVADSKPGDTLPGIERVRVYVKSNDGLSTYNTYSTESDGTVEINTYSDAGLTTPQALPTANSSSVYWKLSPQATSSINGGTPGNYLMVIEVRDVTGVTTIRNQYIYVDNTSPTLTVTQPTEALAVAGSFKIFGTGSDTGGFQTNSIKIEIMFTGSPVGAPYIWYTSPDGLSNWQQIWDTTGPVNFDAVRITFTDKAKNSTVITRNISRDPNPPQFDSFSVTDTDGVATQMTYSTFAGFYSTIIGNSFYLVRGNLTFANQISDANDAISSSSVYIGGTLQNGTGVAETNQVFNPSADASAPYQVGQSSTYPANGLGDGDYRYRANIFQQGGALEIDLNKYFVVDNQKPHIWLLNMKNSDFNGYGTSTNKGHIDTSLNSNGITTNDDDVSGVITMYVKVWDNYLLNNVQVRMADYNFGNGDNGWFNLISRDPSTGVWGTPATRGVIGDLNYFSASIVSQDLTANKDYIYLKLDFNTANLTGVVGLTKNIEFRTYDMAGNESLAGDASTSSEVDRNEDIPGSEPSLTYSSPNSSYQKWVRKTVDVVPYISSIVRSVGAANTMRTKYGKYIVREGETDLTVNGYNLAENGTSWLRVYNTAGSAQDEVTIADYIANATYTALGSVSLATITHSGYVRVMVNGIETINNVNLNTNATNQESSVFTQGSELWNDDRYVHVWKTGTSFNNSLNPVHPAMDMNPSNNALSASWSYYASAQVYYGSTSGRTTIRTSYDPPEYTDIAVDTNGDVHVVYLQNEYANDNATWGYLVSYDSNGGTGYIEHLGNGSGTAPNYSDGMDEQLYQFQNPRITVNNDYNYVSYYDAHSKTLKYGVTTNTTETFTAENPTANRTNGAIVVDGVEDTTAPPTTTGDDVGVWSDIQIDDKMGADVATPRPVIIYYDTTNSKLKIARANGNPTVTRPDNSSEWTKSDVFRTDDPNKNYAGTNVSMKIDSNGDLYVVCYKIDTGDLIYLHAPNIDGDGTYTFDYSTVIDSNGAVGSWADIYVVGTTPYISYLTSGGIGTFYGLKYAYYDTVKSDWEYGIAAANSAVLDKRTSILAVSTGIAAWGGTKGKVAIAYGSSNYDIVYLEDEE